jgi:hypothetical protein
MELDENIGKKYGKLTITKFWGMGKGSIRRYYVKCDCGSKEKIISLSSMKQGVRSCGCARFEIIRKAKHNAYDLTGEYGIGYTFNTNQEFYFDLEDYDKIKDYCWLTDGNGYLITIDIKTKKRIHMSNFIMSKYSDTIDHINNKVYDNRKDNLRNATFQQNACNMRPRISNGVKGISWNKRHSRWEVYLNFKNKRIKHHLCDSLEEAINIRIQYEKEFHKEFRNEWENNIDMNNLIELENKLKNKTKGEKIR